MPIIIAFTYIDVVFGWEERNYDVREDVGEVELCAVILLGDISFTVPLDVITAGGRAIGGEGIKNHQTTPLRVPHETTPLRVVKPLR